MLFVNKVHEEILYSLLFTGVTYSPDYSFYPDKNQFQIDKTAGNKQGIARVPFTTHARKK
jgi:hypothetical protein